MIQGREWHDELSSRYSFSVLPRPSFPVSFLSYYERCPWYDCPKLDHQIVNIRHVQHHAALLSGRLRSAIGVDIGWIGVKS